MRRIFPTAAAASGLGLTGTLFSETDNKNSTVKCERKMQPILHLPAVVKAETEQRTYPSTPRMANMALFSGSSHPKFAKGLADRLGLQVGTMVQETFGNQEHSVQISESVNGRDVYIVQSGAGGAQGDSDLVQLLAMVHTARINSAASITVVIPNYPFARADKVDKPRTPIMAKLVADLLSAAGADHVVTMDLHAGQIQGFFSVPVDNLFASPAITHWLKSCLPEWEEAVLVSPDMGGAKRCAGLASKLSLDFALMHKERVKAGEINRMILVGDVKDRVCVLLDDMSDSCGTLCKAADMLKEAGAKRVIGIVTHGVLSGSALQRVTDTEGLELLVVTNTIPQEGRLEKCAKLRVIDVTPTFAEALRCKQEGLSLDHVFRLDHFHKLP